MPRWHEEIWEAIEQLREEVSQNMSDQQAQIDTNAANVEQIKADAEAAHQKIQKEVDALQAAQHAGQQLDFSKLTQAVADMGKAVAPLGDIAPTPAPPAPAPAPPAPNPPAPTPTPAPSPPAPAPSPEPAPAVPELPLYTHDGDPASIDAAAWPVANVTTDTGVKLYHFNMDTPGGAATGDGAGNVWHAYVGATKPVAA